jgi:hypothetical protein
MIHGEHSHVPGDKDNQHQQCRSLTEYERKPGPGPEGGQEIRVRCSWVVPMLFSPRGAVWSFAIGMRASGPDLH